MGNLAINYNKKYMVTILCMPVSNTIIKRFYPGGSGKLLSVETSQRILRLFNKNDLLTNHYNKAEIITGINNLYKLQGNRGIFFKTLRKVATQNEIDVSKTLINNAKQHLVINQLAKFARLLNLSQKYDGLSVQQISSKKGISRPLKEESFEQRNRKFIEINNKIIANMEKLKITYEKNKTIDWDAINEWNEYLELCKSIEHKYTSQEQNIHEFLKKLFVENTKPKDLILSELKDKLQHFKMQSNLFNIEFFEKMQQKCFTEEDYKDKIKAIQDTIQLLKTDSSLNNDALILLAIFSEAIVLDEENNPKLTREAYELIKELPNEFGIKYTDKKPNSTEIFEALRNKTYLVKQSSDEIPPGHLLSTAPLLHKTILIPTKDGNYYAAMFTSSKAGTESLSLTQESNMNFETANKEQRFIVFSHFILCDNTNITVDLLTLGFSQAKNLQGEDVHQKIIRIFENKQNEWENNFVQELMIVNPVILKNIANMFLEKNIEAVKNEYLIFHEKLDKLSEDKKQDILESYLKNKEDEIYRQNEQKYLSKLSPNFQKLFSNLKFFKNESEHQKKLVTKREEKTEMENKMEERQTILRQEKEERLRMGQLTIREKREAMQKQIKEKAEVNIKAKSILAIENKKEQ